MYTEQLLFQAVVILIVFYLHISLLLVFLLMLLKK